MPKLNFNIHAYIDNLNVTNISDPIMKYVDQMVNDCSVLFPTSRAIVHNNDCITYESLIDKAEKISCNLINAGVKPNDIIVLSLPRGIDFVVALIGILKAGASYLPLDPTHPAERNNRILKNASPKIIISNTGISGEKYETLSFNELATYNGDAKFNYERNPSNLVYVLYTSGSTGFPKGVMISHKNLSSFFNAYRKIIPDRQQLSGLTVCPFTFDVSVWEIFSVLTNGGTLHILDSLTVADPHSFAAYISAQCIENVYIPPAMIDSLSVELSEIGYRGLNSVLVGVEPIKQKSLKKLKDLNPETRIINGYGPTETTIFATCYEFIKVKEPDAITPIGKAIEGNSVYLLDESRKKVQRGERGEICITGDMVALGYLKDDILTNEKFIDDPFGSGMKMYTTGDLAYMNENGDLVFSGRTDNQVKVRGYRIETGEVESAINSITGVKHCAVIITSDEFNVNHLYGFVTLEEGYKYSGNEIRLMLEKILPGYMIPTGVFVLDKIPVTPEGKRDLAKLKLILKGSGKNEIKDLPVNTVESKVYHIFIEVLNRDDILPDGNFFSLGGNSLSAARVTARINKTFDIFVPIKIIYELPSVNDLSDYIKTLKPDLSSKSISIIKQDKTEFPLSVNQYRPWVLYKYDKSNTIYNIQNLFRFSKKISPGELAEKIKILVSRHEILRTIFIEKDSVPEQKVLDEFEVKIKTVPNLAGKLSPDDLERFAHEDNKPFDLGSYPLFRFTLIDDADSSLLLFTIHHIISDGWSIGIFIRELTALINDNSSNHEKPFQYGDYTQSQTAYIASDSFRDDLNIVLNNLIGAPLFLDFPTDFTRPPEQSFKGNCIRFEIDDKIFEEVKKYCLNNNISHYMFFYSCFAVLVHKYSNLTDFIIGSIIAGRNHEEFENTMGLLSNSLLVRNVINKNDSIRKLIQNVKTQSLELFQMQDVPSELLIDRLVSERNLSYNPIFQIAFNYQNMDLGGISESAVKIEPVNFLSSTSMLDLMLTMREINGQVNGFIEYCDELFKERTILNFSKHYLNLVQTILENDNQLVSELNILNHEEIGLIEKYSTAGNHYHKGKSVVELIDIACSNFPDRIAIESATEKITYRDFKTGIDTFSQYLNNVLSLNSKVIAVCMKRSVSQICVISGILKSGNVYLPIDTDHLSGRTMDNISNAKPDLIVTDDQTYTIFENSGILVLNYNSFNPVNEELTMTVSCYPDLNKDAYIIFTSGSTGAPKGVRIKHSSLLHFVSAAINEYAVSHHDKVLQFSSIAFDISVEEIFISLCTGATLVLRSEEIIYSHRKFFEFVSEYKITLIDLPTSFWHELVFALENELVTISDSLRMVIVGGESINGQAVQSWLNLNQQKTELINTYGPTETTVVAAFHKIKSAIQSEVPIGKPFGASRLYILDSNGNHVPIGIQGELYICGDSLSPGYLNDEYSLNFRDIKGVRYFATGDICKLDFDGNFYFVERKDRRIKVRGFNVDPEEIERELLNDSGIEDCVVNNIDGGGNMTQLALYHKSKYANSEIRDYLFRRLPTFMLPDKIYKVNTIPRNENGKVIYNELGNEVVEIQEPEVTTKENSEAERILIEIWKKILNLDDIGINDNFFMLGGNSLKAVRLTSLIKSEFGLDLPLAELFRNGTIKSIADVLSQTEKISGNEIIIPMKPTGRKVSLYCIHGVGGNVLEFEPLTKVIDADQPVFGLQAPGLNLQKEPLESIEEMAERYVEEILAHNPNGPYLLCGSSLGGWIAFEMVRKFRDRNKEVSFIGMFDSIAFRFHSDKKYFERLVLKSWFSLKRILYNLKIFIVAPINTKISNWNRIVKSTKRRLNFVIWKSKVSKYQTTDEELPEQLIQVENANARAAERYILRPNNIKINLFRAKEKTFYIEDFKYLGWKKLAQKGVIVHDVPGDHNSILLYPNVKSLAKILEEKLNEFN